MNRSAGTRTRWAAVVLALAVGAARLPAQPSAGKIDEIEQAREQLSKGKLDEALKLVKQAVAKNPTLSPPRVVMAQLYQSFNRPTEARGQLELAAVETPDHPDVFLANANAAVSEGRLTEGILDCREALRLAKGERWTAEQRKNITRNAEIGLVMAYEARKDWESARTHLNGWLEADPNNALARQRLGQALFLLGKGDEAFAELQTASKADPALDPPELFLGKLGLKIGNKAVAEDWLAKALARHGSNLHVQTAYAEWMLRQGQTDKAREHVEAAAKIDPKSFEVVYLRGLVARQARNFDEAVRTFETLHRDDPGDFNAANQLALTLLEQDDPKQKQRAVQLAEVNARQYPRLVEAIGTLGWAYLRSGRIDEADRAMLPLAPGAQLSPDIAYYLARLLIERSKPDIARQLLEAALASPELFFNRKEAEASLAKLPKKPADAPAAPGK
jgi:tetratricopeptide (TPR) repeat protein